MGGSCIKEKIIRDSVYDSKNLQIKEKESKSILKDSNIDDVSI